ncbi:MAG: pentapeptide repeat-containing protein [Nitrososphaeraceae archaeon]
MQDFVNDVIQYIDNLIRYLEAKDNSQLLNYITGETVLSLFNGTAKIIKDYKNFQKTGYEKSISDLFAFLFRFTFDQINSIRSLKNTERNDLVFLDKNELKNKINLFFSNYKTNLISYNDEIKSPWLPLHPLIQNFKKEAKKWLISSVNKNNKIIEELEKIFEYKIAFNLYNDSIEELEFFRKIEKNYLATDSITKYLDFLIRDFHNFNYQNKKNKNPSSISDLSTDFITNRKAIKLNIKKTWNKLDSEIYKNHINEIQDIDDILNKFLNQLQDNPWNNDTILIIGAPYGVGKTTLLRKLVYYYAIRKGNCTRAYIPIVIYFENGFYCKYENSQLPIDQFVKLLFEDYKEDQIVDIPILLILDGIDEISDNHFLRKNLMEIPFFQNFSNKKIIYSTRLTKELEEISRVEDEYIRLLSFTEQEVNYFLKQKKSDLNYQKIKENYINDEIITVPLILSLFIYFLPELKQDIQNFKKKHVLTEELKKTIIYMKLFYEIFYGKSLFDEKEYENKRKFSYQDEKKILRLIAYYTQLKIDLTFDEIKVLSQQRGIKIENLKTFDTYVIFSSQNLIGNKMEINFINQSYKDFLLAEHLIEKYIEGNKAGLYIEKPSEITISIFKGFLDLLNSDSTTINQFILVNENNRKTLFYSLGYEPNTQQDLVKEVKEKIIHTAKESFNNEGPNIFKIIHIEDLKDNIFPNFLEKLKYYRTFFSDVNNYYNLWLQRWVSLVALRYLGKEIAIDKKILSNFLIYHSQNIPYYLKYLHTIDLSESNLSGSNLSDADLSYANLYHSNLSNANLSNANLSHANLHSAILSNADLSGTNLSYTCLYYSNFFHVNLSGADLSNADLHDTSFYYANFTNANLSTIQNGADFSYAYLAHANLSNANMENGVFWGVDLSNAILKGVKFYDVTFSWGNLSNTDLSNSKLCYNTSFYYSNLQNANFSNAVLTNVYLSYADLSSANLSNSIIIQPRFYDDIILNSKTDFKDAIIDDSNFINYLKEKSCKNIPDIIKNKKELKEKLEKKSNIKLEFRKHAYKRSDLPQE